jgi:subtilisin family serine protease
MVSEIAMPINNGIGGAGTGNFSVLPIRVTSPSGNTTDAWIQQGIAIAAQNDCRVITISLAASSYSSINNAVSQALAANALAGKKDFLVFMAGGNGNTFKTLGSADLDNASQRLAADHLIMVGGTDETDQRWVNGTFDGSDVGPFLDISAPAHLILVEDGINNPNYARGSGTSFATPFAASAAALAFSINPDLSASQVQNLLFDTAFNPNNPHPGTPYWDQTYGWGRVDFGALAAAAAATVPEPASLMRLAAGVGTMLLSRRRRSAGE